jgi:hypothetical protein
MMPANSAVNDYDDSMRKRGLPDKPHEFIPQEYARDCCAYQPTPQSPRCNLSRMNTVAHSASVSAVDEARDSIGPRWVVSVVVVEDKIWKTHVLNKLYDLTATSREEAHGKALTLSGADFPSHRLHTICSLEIKNGDRHA